MSGFVSFFGFCVQLSQKFLKTPLIFIGIASENGMKIPGIISNIWAK